MIEQRVSARYAKAILQTAQKEGFATQIYDDFQKINETMSLSRELRSLTASPVFQMWRKKEIYLELFNTIKISKLAMDFLILLLDKRRGVLIPSIIYQYVVQFNKLNNRLTVDITSAIELTDNIKEKVLARLADMTKMTILPNFLIDKSIKGGIIVKIDDWVYNISVRNQLEILYKSLSEGV